MFNTSGNCYEVAGRFMLDSHRTIPDLRLVHGTVTSNKELGPFGHAWIEIGDVVIDGSNDSSFVGRKEDYYKRGAIQDVVSYEPQEALSQMSESGTFGPWHETDARHAKKTAYQAEDLDEKEPPRGSNQEPEPYLDIPQPSMRDGEELIIPAVPVRYVRKRIDDERPSSPKPSTGPGGYPSRGWSVRPIHQAPEDVDIGQVTAAVTKLPKKWDILKDEGSSLEPCNACRTKGCNECNGLGFKGLKRAEFVSPTRIKVYRGITLEPEQPFQRDIIDTIKNDPLAFWSKNFSEAKKHNPNWGTLGRALGFASYLNTSIQNLHKDNAIIGGLIEAEIDSNLVNPYQDSEGYRVPKKGQYPDITGARIFWQTNDNPCPACEGTGNGVRGKRFGCKQCRGMGIPDFDPYDSTGSYSGWVEVPLSSRVAAIQVFRPQDLEDWTETIGPVAYHDPALTDLFWTSGVQDANSEHKKRIPAILRKGLLSGTSMKQGWMGGRPNHSYLAVPNGKFGPYVEKFPLVVDITKLDTDNIHADEDALGFVQINRADFMSIPGGFKSVGEYADSVIKDSRKDIGDSLNFGSFAYNTDIQTDAIRINPAWIRENQTTIDKWAKKDEFWQSGYKKFLYKGECFGCDGTGSTICYDCKGVGNEVCEGCNGKPRRCYECKGTKLCDECKGTGKDSYDSDESCFQCDGTKQCTSCEDENGEPTGKVCKSEINLCYGTGRESCTKCGEMGQRTCRVCEGKKWFGRRKQAAKQDGPPYDIRGWTKAKRDRLREENAQWLQKVTPNPGWTIDDYRRVTDDRTILDFPGDLVDSLLNDTMMSPDKANPLFYPAQRAKEKMQAVKEQGWKAVFTASNWRHTDEDGFEMWETTEDPNQYAIIENNEQYDLYALQGSFDSPEEAKAATEKFGNWKSIARAPSKIASWFDQVETKEIEVPEQPVMTPINAVLPPPVEAMYERLAPTVEEEEEEKSYNKPTAFDLWSVHGSNTTNRYVGFDELDDESKASLMTFYRGVNSDRVTVQDPDAHARRFEYRLEHVPTSDVKDAILTRINEGKTFNNQFLTWDEYADWFARGEEVPTHKSRWPILRFEEAIPEHWTEDGDFTEVGSGDSDWRTDEWKYFEDGYHRLHSYINAGDQILPFLSARLIKKSAASKKQIDPNQTSLLEPATTYVDERVEERDEAYDRDRKIEQNAEDAERSRKSPLGETFDFVTQPAKNVNYGDTCMNGMMTCQHGGKIMAGQPLVHVIDPSTKKVLFRFHPDDEVGTSCKQNATEYLHEFVQRKP